MGKNCPLVSVVMPAYNAEKYIQTAIESVQNQTVLDFELIVIDDCSTDNTRMIVETMGRTDARISLVRNEKNIGVAHTRNRAFELCSGEYIALLDSDDIWYPTKLEKQLEAARSSGADIVYCSYGIINEDSKKICADFIVPEVTSLEDMLDKSVISCSTALLSAEIVREQLFPVDYYHEDYVYWLQLRKSGKKAIGITEVLAAYRVCANSRASNKVRSAKQRWKIYREFLRLPLGIASYHFLRYAWISLLKYKRN